MAGCGFGNSSAIVSAMLRACLSLQKKSSVLPNGLVGGRDAVTVAAVTVNPTEGLASFNINLIVAATFFHRKLRSFLRFLDKPVLSDREGAFMISRLGGNFRSQPSTAGSACTQ